MEPFEESIRLSIDMLVKKQIRVIVMEHSENGSVETHEMLHDF